MPTLGQGTQVVDGQRNTFAPMAAFAPAVYGQQTTGVPNVTPTVPPFLGSGGGGTTTAAAMGSASVNGYGTAGNNDAVTAIAAANPHSFKVAPTWWAVIFLVGGVLALNAVSWKETVEEHGGVGPVHERAEAGA